MWLETDHECIVSVWRHKEVFQSPPRGVFRSPFPVGQPGRVYLELLANNTAGLWRALLLRVSKRLPWATPCRNRPSPPPVPHTASPETNALLRDALVVLVSFLLLALAPRC